MKVKCIKKASNSYLEINKIYSIISIEISFKEYHKGNKVKFICVEKDYFDSNCLKNSGAGYFSIYHYTPIECFKILSDVLPNNWVFYVYKESISIEPKIFENYWEYLDNDYGEAREIFKRESLKIIAFDSQKDMRGFFAEELLDYMKENGYKPENLSQWAKDYNLKLLKEMYDQEVHPDITALIDDFGLYDWNSDLAIPEQELKEKLMKWSEEGKVEYPSTISFQDILEKYAKAE